VDIKSRGKVSSVKREVSSIHPYIGYTTLFALRVVIIINCTGLEPAGTQFLSTKFFNGAIKKKNLAAKLPMLLVLHE